jgi:hypothetical protein
MFGRKFAEKDLYFIHLLIVCSLGLVIHLALHH